MNITTLLERQRSNQTLGIADRQPGSIIGTLLAAMGVYSKSSRFYVETAEHEACEETLAEYYELAQWVDTTQYQKAA